MDNAQKAIMIGVGLFITIIIISVVLLITNLGKTQSDLATTELKTMTSQLQNSLRTAYDNKTTTGAEVLSLYNQYEGNASFLLVFDVDSDSDSAHKADNSELYYNNNGFSATFTGISRTAGKMYVNYVKTGTATKMPTGISTLIAATPISELVDSSDVYQTYLIKDGDTVVGVYARLRATTGSGIRGMDTTAGATTI